MNQSKCVVVNTDAIKDAVMKIKLGGNVRFIEAACQELNHERQLLSSAGLTETEINEVIIRVGYGVFGNNIEDRVLS